MNAMSKVIIVVLVIVAGISVCMLTNTGKQAAVAAKGEVIAKVQTTCPVMGGKINKSMFTDVLGKRIYVCCSGCIAKINAEPAKHIKILEDRGEGVERL